MAGLGRSPRSRYAVSRNIFATIVAGVLVVYLARRFVGV